MEKEIKVSFIEFLKQWHINKWYVLINGQPSAIDYEYGDYILSYLLEFEALGFVFVINELEEKDKVVTLQTDSTFVTTLLEKDVECPFEVYQPLEPLGIAKALSSN